MFSKNFIINHERSSSSNNNKITRWDRISKRYAHHAPFTLKSDTVRRFIEMDFIGKHNERLLNGDTGTQQLDPILVMDMRHQMFQKNIRKLPIATLANRRNLANTISHNAAVEDRYIENELSKFRQQLERDHTRNKLKRTTISSTTTTTTTTTMTTTTMVARVRMHKLDNGGIMESLEAASRHIEDFYMAPIDAFEEVQKIFRNNEGDNGGDGGCQDDDGGCQSDENDGETSKNSPEIIDRSPGDNSSPSSSTCFNETLDYPKPQEIHSESQSQSVDRHCCVHFERSSKFMIKFGEGNQSGSSSSISSDGIDSVVSDLAEEALRELQLEIEEGEDADQRAKINGKDYDRTLEMPKEETPTQSDNHADNLPEGGHELALENLAPPAENSVNNDNDFLIIRRLDLPELRPPRLPMKKASDSLSFTDTDDGSTSDSSREQNKIIEQLFQARTHAGDSDNEKSLRTSFLKWIHYTTMEKIERDNCKLKGQQRTHLIQVFLDKIRREKGRLHRHCRGVDHIEATGGGGDGGEGVDDGDGDYDDVKAVGKKKRMSAVVAAKKYHSKIKMQQDIIDLQRHKLERQERLIMQLKLNKFSDEAKEAREELKKELKSVIRSGDAKSKAKAKCLQLIGGLRDEEDEELARLHGRALVMPRFLQKMHERALERSVKHEQARQRRLQLEAEREAQKIAAEEAKRLEDEEAKRMRIEALKAKRRAEKMAKIIKEREHQRAMENHQKAKDFCRRMLLRRIGMEGFKRLLQRKRDNQRKSVALRSKIFVRRCFVAWRQHYELMRDSKNAMADELHARMLCRASMEAWKRYAKDERSKFLVACDFYDFKLSNAIFDRWYGYVQRMKIIEEAKMRQAVAHHEWNLKWKVLDCWQRLPQILQLEKETEERRQRWRMKIWELLPDYTPNVEIVPPHPADLMLT